LLTSAGSPVCIQSGGEGPDVMLPDVPLVDASLKPVRYRSRAHDRDRGRRTDGFTMTASFLHRIG